MGIWKYIRRRSKPSRRPNAEVHELTEPPGPNRLTTLPDQLLAKIFHHVSPYSLDESYDTTEQSMIPGCCGLCGLKDLHSCALLNRKSYMIIQRVLYKSIRIDAVHFCSREYELAQVRLRQRVDTSDVVPTRLHLLQRLARLRPDIAADVFYLKLPYMLREALPGDVLLLVASFPSLRYIDLPAAFFSADPSLSLLRIEVAKKCPQLRRMAYRSGSENAFNSLLRYPVWSRLERLDLEGIQMDFITIRTALATFPALSCASLVAIPHLDDTLFDFLPITPDFPSLETLRIESIPGLTSTGLTTYLKRPEVARSLRSLSLRETGVKINSLAPIFRLATKLEFFSIVQTIDKPHASDTVQPLHSSSLATMHFEVTSSSTIPGLERCTDGAAKSSYRYLASSVRNGSLPSLSRLYVRDAEFASLLTTYSPPLSPVSKLRTPSRARSGTSPACNAIDLFTKGPDDSNWYFSEVDAQRAAESEASLNCTGRLRNQGRPVSAFLATEGSGIEWAGQARKSVIMPDAGGGFFAVPGAAQDVEAAPQVPTIPKAFADLPVPACRAPNTSYATT